MLSKVFRSELSELLQQMVMEGRWRLTEKDMLEEIHYVKPGDPLKDYVH